MNERERILGKWAAKRGYDRWEIFNNKRKWCNLTAITDNPIKTMIDLHPFAEINWKKVKAVKLS